jgi:hypothetical protein
VDGIIPGITLTYGKSVQEFSAPIYFLGRTASLGERLRTLYLGITWEPVYRLKIEFATLDPDSWPGFLPRRKPALVFVEMVPEEMGVVSVLLQALRAFNPTLQFALLADDEVDYFQVAQECSVGNVLKKNAFDAALLRALTVRLLTGNIFGFEPYFQNGYTVGPLFRTYSGTVKVQSVIDEAFAFGEPYIHAQERGNFRMFLHEMLLNTFSYAIQGITAEVRDATAATTPATVDIPERRGIKLMLAVDREKVGFSVTDSTGSLSMLRLLQKLRRQSRIAGELTPPGLLDETGRGMSLLYRYSRFIVNILRGVRTETIFLQYHEQELNRFESIIITEVNPV